MTRKEKDAKVDRLNLLINKVIAPGYMKEEIIKIIADLIKDAYLKGKK